MKQSGKQNLLGAMLLASGATLVVILGGRALQAPSAKSYPSPQRMETTGDWTSISPRYQSDQRSQGNVIQANFDEETTEARYSLRTLPDHGFENSDRMVSQIPNASPANTQQGYAAQDANTQREDFKYPLSQRVVHGQIPPIQRSEQRIDLKAPRHQKNPHWEREFFGEDNSKSEKANPQQESDSVLITLETIPESIPLAPGSASISEAKSREPAPSVTNPTTPIRIDKQVRKANWAEIELKSAIEPTLSADSFQQPMLPRQKVPLQAEARARKHIQYGESLARRRSFYAAREEFVLALLLLSNSHKSVSNTDAYANRFAQALTAMDEVGDFAELRNTGDRGRFQQTVLSHRTRLIGANSLAMTSPNQAIDLYCGFAQSQIEQSIGYSAAGSEALHALGKLESMVPGNPQRALTTQTRALVFFRSALSVNPANAICANDLGVLLFNLGRLNEAEESLRASLLHAQTQLGWSNIAAVHSQLASGEMTGEQRNYQLRLANLAEKEAQKFQTNPRDSGLASSQWATANEFQENAAFSDTVVHRATNDSVGNAQQGSGKIKQASFIEKVTGWN